MMYQWSVRWLWGLLFAWLPLAGEAALQDWYGGWSVSYAGDDAGNCDVIISQLNATQATITATCRSPALGQFTGNGVITGTGSLSVTGTLYGVVFSGAIQGNSGSGQWYSAEFNAGGTWTTSRVTVTPADGIAAPGFTLPQGIIPETSVTIQATGDVYRKTLAVDLKIENIFTQALAASGYNVYVAALVANERIGLPAGGGTWFVKTQIGAWEVLSYPLKAFMESVAVSSQDQRVRVEILSEINLSTLLGTEIYIGYGTSGDEMIQNRRYRGVFDVQP